MNARVATTPFAIVLEFMPQITHVEAPEVVLQLIDLPAAVVAAPAVMLREAMSLRRIQSRSTGGPLAGSPWTLTTRSR